MKILYLVHQFYPKAYTGTEKFVLQLAQRCQLSGHTVQVVTYDMPKASGVAASPPLTSMKQRVKAALHMSGLDPIQLRTLPAKLLPNRILTKTYRYQEVPVFAFAHQRYPGYADPQRIDHPLRDFARNLLLRERPDVVHAGHTLRVTEFLQAAAELQIPYLLTLTDFWAICPNCKLLNEGQQLCHGPRGGEECQSACPGLQPKRTTQRLAQMRLLFGKAASVVAPARFLAEKVQAEFETPTMTVIPYGIDIAQLKPNTRRYPTTEPLVFFFAGTFLETKGIQLLLQAFQTLSADNIRLEIYGSGKLLGEVQRATQKDKRIVYGGIYQIEQLGELLNRVDVVVVPSIWHENLPLIMQEAQACGVPTLVSDVGGMTECVADGVNGFTFRVGDVADLQRKLQRIIDQPEILNGMKENIRNPKPGQYRVTSLEEEAALYMAQYQSILEKRCQAIV